MKTLIYAVLLAVGTTGLVLAYQNDNGNNGNAFGVKEHGNGKGNSGNGNGNQGSNGGGSSAHYAPEIDPAAAVSALALLSGGALVIGGRRK